MDSTAHAWDRAQGSEICKSPTQIGLNMYKYTANELNLNLNHSLYIRTIYVHM